MISVWKIGKVGGFDIVGFHVKTVGEDIIILGSTAQ